MRSKTSGYRCEGVIGLRLVAIKSGACQKGEGEAGDM